MRYAMNTLCIRRFAQTAALIAILGLSACSAMKNGFEPERADYRKTQSSPALVIPADLRPVVPESDQRLQAPSATFGPLNRKGSTPALSNLTVDCTREPCQLTARATPEQLWPHLREFWLQLGFTLAQDRPDLGLIETDWAENRARIPNDWLRQKLGRFADRLYSSGTRAEQCSRDFNRPSRHGRDRRWPRTGIDPLAGAGARASLGASAVEPFAGVVGFNV